MKRSTICIAGLGAGAILAATTDYPVLEKMGISFDKTDKTALVSEAEMSDVPKAMEGEGSASKAMEEVAATKPSMGQHQKAMADAGDAIAKAPANLQQRSKRVVVNKVPMKDSEQPEAEKAMKAPEELDGKWLVTRAVHGQSKIPFNKLQAMTLEVAGKEIVIGQGDKREVGKLESSPASKIGETSFAEIKISSTSGKQEDIHGFYYLVDGELTMIWGAPGEARPDPTDKKQFATARILTLKAAE